MCIVCVSQVVKKNTVNLLHLYVLHFTYKLYVVELLGTHKLEIARVLSTLICINNVENSKYSRSTPMKLNVSCL